MNYELPTEIVSTLIILISIIFADFIIGVFVSIKEKTFDINKLPNFIIKSILPYLGGLIILAIASKYIGSIYTGIFFSSAAAVFAKYSNELRIKVNKLFEYK